LPRELKEDVAISSRYELFIYKGKKMPGYYDENYGWYDIECEEDVEFYRLTQRESIRKKCEGCNRMVKIRSDYAYCNSCADKVEKGLDI